MASNKPSRKQLFRAALAIAGKTMAQWAEDEDYAPEHVSRVLNGRVVGSQVLLGKIDDFTEKKLVSRTVTAA